MLNSILKNVQTAFHGRSSGPSRCLAVCIDHQTRMWAGVGPGDIDFLVDRLMEKLSTEASYDGQVDMAGETRLYFHIPAPNHALPVVLTKLREIPWCRGSRVLTRSNRFRLWNTHLL